MTRDAPAAELRAFLCRAESKSVGGSRTSIDQTRTDVKNGEVVG